ncbi:hypothetical protein AB0D14_30975 [Streptomyces sp. NPDC048484]
MSSWEYQQSPSFADTDTWHRAETVAEALAALLGASRPASTASS